VDVVDIGVANFGTAPKAVAYAGKKEVGSGTADPG
jgi:hypothetical protein